MATGLLSLQEGMAVENKSNLFYDDFSSKYDLMISRERYKRVIPFFLKFFTENNVYSILDCSSGTGRHAIALSELGFEVEGSDMSAKMVQQAKLNAADAGAKVNFTQADFKRLPEMFNRKFDCVICIGNSLSHELEDTGLLAALKSMHGVLNDKGLVILQIRNLPKLIKENWRIFPIHQHKEPNGDLKLFFYVLDFHPQKSTFNVVSYLETDGVPQFEVNSVDYNILSESRLASLMTQAGFTHLRVFGSFESASFCESESGDIIIVGNKS